MNAYLSRLTAFASRLLFKRRKTHSIKRHDPVIVDYETIGLVWRPYVMRLTRPNQVTPSVRTDGQGFRISHFRGEAFPFQQYRDREDVSALLGNSAAFGVGASKDANCLASQLALIYDQPWFNFAGRASNLMQDVLTFLLFGAPRSRNIVLMSGVNDLLFALTFESASCSLPTFWGNDLFQELNKRDTPDMARGDTKLPVEQRYMLALQGIDRALLLLSRYARDKHTRILFALQPLLAWIDKPLHAEERVACQDWDAILSGFRATHKPEVIRPWKDRYPADLRSICKMHEIEFVDLNPDPAWLTGERLFVDRIHLTDRGQRIAAELIRKHLS